MAEKIKQQQNTNNAISKAAEQTRTGGEAREAQGLTLVVRGMA